MSINHSIIKKLSVENYKPEYPCFVFGMHKGGSTMLHDFFNIICNKAKIRSVDAPGIAFVSGVSDEDFNNNLELAELFKDNAVYFGFRYIPFFLLQKKSHFLNHKSIILLRDPRDCVVSAYYSFLKTHPLSNDINSGMSKQIIKERIENENTNIDSYCKKEIHRFVQEIIEYVSFCNPNTKVYRYEDIIFKKREFFEDVLDHLGLDVSSDIFDFALSEVDVVPKKENNNSHIRSVKPGNHTQKLKKDTINEINAKHKIILNLMGY